jgi:hypothetical protein
MSFKNVILACAIALSVLSTSAIGAGGASLQLVSRKPSNTALKMLSFG